MRGFAWGRGVGFSTEDGGHSWVNREVKSLFVEGSPRPVVDEGGRLWVASRTMRNSASQFWLTVLDSSFREMLKLAAPGGIDRMVPHGMGVWALGRDGGYGEATLWQVEASPDRPPRIERLAAINHDLPIGLIRHGSQVAVALAHIDGLTSTRYVLAGDASGDRANWRRYELGHNDSLEAICLGPADELWVAGRDWLWRLSSGEASQR